MTNLAESLFRRLQADILSGKHPVGSRLPPERQLAGELGATRNTLREAVRKLESMGLVATRRGSGVTVLDFRSTGSLELLGPFLVHGADPRERLQALRDLLMLRTDVLERAVRLAADRALDADADAISVIAAQQRQRYQRSDVAALAVGDLDLISAVVDAAHSVVVRWSANALIDIGREIVDLQPQLYVIGPVYLDWLDGLCRGIAERDPEVAAEATRRWLDTADRQLLETLAVFEQQLAHLSPQES